MEKYVDNTLNILTLVDSNSRTPSSSKKSFPRSSPSFIVARGLYNVKSLKYKA